MFKLLTKRENESFIISGVFKSVEIELNNEKLIIYIFQFFKKKNYGAYAFVHTWYNIEKSFFEQIDSILLVTTIYIYIVLVYI